MDPSLGFITTLIDQDQYNEAIRSGITSDFLSEDHIPVWNYIQRHRGEYGSVPSRAAVRQAFPSFEFGRYKEPLAYFIDSLKEQYRKRVLDEGIHNVADIYDRDTKGAEALLRQTLSALHVTGKSHQDVSLASSATDRIEAYQKRKENPGADGILSGWESLDYQTLGWHPEEFVVLVGEKWTGKSWMMLWLAYEALKQGERVLMVTKEMSQDALTRRFDSLYSGVPFDKLRRGELSDAQEGKYREGMEKLASSGAHFVIARQGVNTVEDIESKAIETDATIIFADSVYLFPPDARNVYSGETNKRLQISQKCKEISTRLRVPFVVSVQAGRKKSKNAKPDLDSIEWSNAFSQDAETVVYIEKTELDVELRRRSLHLLKSRDGDLAEFFIETDFENMRFPERDDQVSPSTDVFEDDELDLDE